MDEPEIAQYKPCLVKVEAGKRYFWCSCGRSSNQPFCDSSHRGTNFLPLVWTADETGEKLFCACKRTRSQPFCDGSHNSLSDTYAEAGAEDGANARLVDYQSLASGAMKASLDNGCYVIRVPDAALRANGTLRLYPTISADDGARHMSQYTAIANPGTSPILRFAECDVTLFALSGSAVARIADREFGIGPETGVAIRPGEGFQLVVSADSALLLNITVCPHCNEVEFPEQMPDYFDNSVSERAQGVDESKQEAMGDRFFQVLVDHESHKTPITQFIGEIPRSRAAHHHHLYEETITVLSGEGFMWTDNSKTPVKAGDTIFLPLKQAHSLECTTADGMRMVGQFYPSMSPAINY